METGATKATVKAVALISGATSVKGSLHFVQGPNGISVLFLFPLFLLVKT